MRARSIFFWILVLLCLATIPSIIIYNFGYRYSFTKGIFVYTGSVTIKANPQSVDITIDGKPVDAQSSTINSSYHISGLDPGHHIVTVSAPGFRPWSKEVTVSSGISTEFWNILITREQYAEESHPARGILRAYTDPAGRLIAYASRYADESTVSVLDTKTGETRQVFSSLEDGFGDTSKENLVEWSRNSDQIIVSATRDGRNGYFVIDTDSLETSALKDIVPDGGDIRAVRWDSARDDTLFYVAGQSLWRLSLPDRNRTLVAEHLSAYDLSGGSIYYLETPSGLIWKLPIDATNETRPVQVTTDTPSGLAAPEDFSLVVYDEGRLYLIDYDHGSLYLYNDGTQRTSFDRIAGDVSGAQFSNDGKKLLYWNGHDIHVRFVREWNVQPFRSEGQTLDIARFAQSIDNIQWSKDYEHVIFSMDDTVKVAELDNRNRNTTDVFTATIAPEQIFQDFRNNLLYIVTPENSENTGTLSSIRFPEPNGLFGRGG